MKKRQCSSSWRACERSWRRRAVGCPAPQWRPRAAAAAAGAVAVGAAGNGAGERRAAAPCTAACCLYLCIMPPAPLCSASLCPLACCCLPLMALPPLLTVAPAPQRRARWQQHCRAEGASQRWAAQRAGRAAPPASQGVREHCRAVLAVACAGALAKQLACGRVAHRGAGAMRERRAGARGHATQHLLRLINCHRVHSECRKGP